MLRKCFQSLILGVALLMMLYSEIAYATEVNGVYATVVIDLDEVQAGDSIQIYEDSETGEKFAIDVLPQKAARTDVGMDDWSGVMPMQTLTLYPNYSAPINLYKEIGFYVTYDGYECEILETYGETIDCRTGYVTEVDSRIITASPTSSVHAKAEMSWMHYDVNIEGAITGSETCYIRLEINCSNQLRVVWRVND